MNALFLFELKQLSNRWSTYLIALSLLLIGVFCGLKFNFTVGDGIFLNSSYSIGFMVGIMSLVSIFFAILISNQLLFKEWDAKFDLIIFALPLTKWQYMNGKFWMFYFRTFSYLVVLILGFIVGQSLREGSEMQTGFNSWHYIYPLVVFGFLNNLLVCSVLFFISYTTRKKLLVVVGGLLLYVLYMVILLFSNSPFMVGSLPQSIDAQQLSAILDPFGLSAYFFEARDFSVQEKNVRIVPMTGFLFLNRLLILLLSGCFLWLSYTKFSFRTVSKKKSKKTFALQSSLYIVSSTPLQVPKLSFETRMSLKSALSFAKIDLIYLFKSTTIAAVSLLLLFYIGMEMYATIDQGIRLPQLYASSGLLAGVITDNFHLMGALILVYFVNDLYWRSETSGFHLIEKSSYFSKSKLNGHLLSVSVLLFFLTILLIVEVLVFQLSYSYYRIDWAVYLGVFVFNTLPLLLFGAGLLLINNIFRNRFVALGISTIAVFAFVSPLSKQILCHPLLQLFSGYKGVYSDFNGYGIYLNAFLQRLLFGASCIILLWRLPHSIKRNVITFKKVSFVLVVAVFGAFVALNFMKGYIPKNEADAILKAVQYEKDYRNFEHLPQPTITDISTEIRLFPTKNAYQIVGSYLLKNLSNQPIEWLLINFDTEVTLESAFLTTSAEQLEIKDYIKEIRLKQPLQPNATASLNFTLNYQWFAVNGHRSFNAIISNGSFMRISRYYPIFGYQSFREIEDEHKRAEFQLSTATELKKVEAPEAFETDFINLKMTVSTENNQTAIGTGDLINQWTKDHRNYYEYQAKQIPFRFAVASAEFQHQTEHYKGIDISVFYNKTHFENVEHLLKNAKISLDYCQQYFGTYPFKSVNFVEVSSFTKGFAATAYPSAIFMTEDMLFHANLQSDAHQDVINELAGHELSHLWWGNNQIDADDREGATLLTETLAMYTELMLYKKMYDKEKMLERVNMHQQIYDTEKGFSNQEPLYKVSPKNVALAYSKGAVVMVKLSELIGEERVNLALKNFLLHNTYPKKPSTLDLLQEIYAVVDDAKLREEIDVLFKKI